MGVLFLGLAAAGCSTSGVSGLMAEARSATVAIESVEGAPAPVVHKFMRDLTAEAAQHQIALMTWGGGATYRLRGYLAARTRDEPPTIAWAWDVYDTSQHRVFRLSGEARTAPGRKSWPAADDAVLARIARAGMEQLVTFLASPGAPVPVPDAGPPIAAAPPLTGRDSSIVAVLDDFRPEAAGVFRLFGRGATDASNESANAGVPLPRERPFIAEATSLTYAAEDR